MALKPIKENRKKIKPSKGGKVALKAAALRKSFGPPAKTFEEAGRRAKKRMALAEDAENC